MSHRFLIIGCGSAGERHLKNLQLLGVECYVYDRDVERMKKLTLKYKVPVYDFASHHLKMDAWIICTPPSSHILFAEEALSHDSNIFIEKPLSNTLDRVDDVIAKVKSQKKILMIGYQFRFNEALKHIKSLIEKGEIGRVMCIRAEIGQDLRDWHPEEDYRNLYTCETGIVSDASHEIDYVRWLTNSDVVETQGMCGKLSDLEMVAEDTAEINMRFENGIIANVHLDCTQRAYSRWCEVIGTKGTLKWTYPNQVICTYSNEIDTSFRTFPNNDMYLAEMQHFINCTEGKEKPIVDGEVGKRVLEICLKAKGELK